MAFSFTRGGKTSRGIAAYISLLFSPVGLIIIIYVLIGVFYNTAPPIFRRLLAVLRRSTAGYSTSSRSCSGPSAFGTLSSQWVNGRLLEALRPRDWTSAFCRHSEASLALVRRARFGPGLWPGPRRQARWGGGQPKLSFAGTVRRRAYDAVQRAACPVASSDAEADRVSRGPGRIQRFVIEHLAALEGQWCPPSRW